MAIENNWITSELKRLFPGADLAVGVDLNRNGRLEANEKIATFNNNTIPGNKSDVIGDWTDWLAFYRRNVAQLAKLEQGKSIFALSARFKATNPLHTITTIESAVSTPEKVKATYETVFRMYSKMKAKDSPALTPPEKLLDVYGIIRAENMSIGGNVVLLLDGLPAKRLDCDTSSFVISAVAYEIGWPVYLVSVPEHVFIRWDNGKTGQHRVRFNLDSNGSFTDNQYQQAYGISPTAVSQNVYLRNIGEKSLIAMVVANRGSAKSELGKHQEAIKDMDEALRLDPACPDVYVVRGLAKQSLEKYQDAIRDYDQAIRLNSMHSIAYNNRGIVKFKLGRYLDAIKDLDESIRLNPKRAMAYYNRCSVKHKLGRHVEAIHDCDHAMKMDPKDAKAYYNRAYIHFDRGRYDDAIKDLDIAIRLNPNDEGAYCIRGRAKYLVGKFHDAIKDLDEAIRLDPTCPEAYIVRGSAKYKLGKYHDAIKDYTKTITLNSAYADAHHNRGLAWYRLGKYQEAIGDYDAAIRLDPRYARAYYSRGAAKTRLGRNEEARKDFEKAKELGLRQ